MPTIVMTSNDVGSNRDAVPPGPAMFREVAKAADEESYMIVVFAFNPAHERIDEAPLPPPTRFVRGQGTPSSSWTITEKIVQFGSGLAPKGPANEQLSECKHT